MVYSLVASCLFAIHAPHTPPTEIGIPQHLHGVWTVVSASNNGTKLPIPKNPNSTLADGECQFTEIIVCKSRVVIVLHDGRAIYAKTRVLVSEPQTKIEMIAPRYRFTDEEASFAILNSINDKKFHFAICPKESKYVDRKNGGNQIVLTAKR